MKKLNTLSYLFVVAILCLPGTINAQTYLSFSDFSGGSADDNVAGLQVVNGRAYLVGYTKSANFPVTNGTVFRGLSDITITCYDLAGNVVYATYLGGNNNETVNAIKVADGELYLLGQTESNNFPVTTGTIYQGQKDIFITKLTNSGSIAFSTLLGGNRGDVPANELQIIAGELIVYGSTGSANFPITNGSSFGGGVNDAFISKLSLVTGSLIASGFYGGNNEDVPLKMEFDSNDLYLVGNTKSSNLPITIGNAVNDTLSDGFAIRINRNDLTPVYTRYIGGPGTDAIAGCRLFNGSLHLAGTTYSFSFPVTNGSQPALTSLDYADGFYTRLDNTGELGFSTYVSTNNLDLVTDLLVSATSVYIIGGRSYSPVTGEQKIIISQLANDGSAQYRTSLSLGFGIPGILSFALLGDDLYASGITRSATFPVTDGSQFYSAGSGFFTHLDPSGNIAYSGLLGQMNSLLPMRLINGRFYLLGNTDLQGYPLSNPSQIVGGLDNLVIVKNASGQDIYAGYIGGSDHEFPAAVDAAAEDIYIAGRTLSANYPVTNVQPYNGNGDQFLTKLSSCPGGFNFSADTLSPKSQTACKFGLAEKIVGGDVVVPSDSLPTIYLGGFATLQEPVRGSYQWQTAGAISGPWENVPGAIFKDYTPSLGASDKYFRRLSFSSAACGNDLIHISDTARVTANLLTAPVVDGGGPFITCPGTPVTIGGNPTVSGGNPPYLFYVWDLQADSVPNPTVTVSGNTIFSLVVTDQLGCRQVGQSLVLAYRADGGPDRGACGGVATQIGGLPVPGIPGPTYQWQPSTALSADNIPQPFANPSSTTLYELTVTIPIAGGGSCSTTDTVRVTPVAPPVTANFAGPDQYLCLAASPLSGDSAFLGAPGEANFNYVWSPGSYIARNNTPTIFYYPGNTVMPEPNPAVLQVTAQKDGCSFPDQVTVATIEARAGLDACGPRILGLPDRTPAINETYTWTKISGPGELTGPTNLPQVPVSASDGAITTYQLTVTYNGHSCIDEVRVPPNCTGCVTTIEVDARYRCADYDVNGGNVSLIAFSDLPNAIYSWTPQVGLSAYTGAVVNLTDNVARIYTVTARDANDTTLRCSYNIIVNDPAFSQPIFPAPDTVTCLGLPVEIGLPPVAGYTYEWTGTGLSGNLVSNPIATVLTQTSFPVKVSDGNGCELRDTVTVRVQNIRVSAGPDWILCSSGSVKLGAPPQPNTSYLWEPAAAWLNGTTEFSAQPEVFIASNATFTVTGTSTGGCITKDTVNIFIDTSPELIDATDKTICRGQSVQIGNPGIPGVQYQWSPAIGLSNPNIAQPFANPQVTTNYILTATFPGSCIGTVTDAVTVTVNSAAFNIPDITFCPADGPIALGVNAPPGMSSYNWQPAGLVTNATIANPSTLNPPPKTATLFTLTVTNANGCTHKDTINLIPLIVAPAAGPDRVVCNNTSTIIGANGNVIAPGITYEWSPVDNLNDPFIPNPVYTGNGIGIFTYVLTKTDLLSGCSSRDTMQIRVVDISLVVPNVPPVCENSCVQIGPAAQPGIQYAWSPSDGLSNPGIASPITCVTDSTKSYTLVATDLNGCTASEVVIIAVVPGTSPVINLPGLDVCVGATDVSFQPIITPAGNYTYLWSPNNGTLSNILIPDPIVTIPGAGISTYTLQVTDTATGCSNLATSTLTVTNCPDEAVIGDFAWYDTNENGLQDAGEAGASGITVQLFNEAGFNIATTNTNADGLYFFSNLPAGDNYYVRFDLPPGYLFTQQNIGGIGSTNNSKVDNTGLSNTFDLAVGQTKLDIDAGLIVNPCGPVPVLLLSFTGALRGGEVYLNWETSAEINNDHFDVTKSADAVSFSKIGSVAGSGTTSVSHRYSFIDSKPHPGTNYYRLRQVDTDGNAVNSPIVAITFDKQQELTAYYLPASHTIKLTFGNLQENARIKLFGYNGQFIASGSALKGTSEYSLPVPVLARGTYLVQLVFGKDMLTKKIHISR